MEAIFNFVNSKKINVITTGGTIEKVYDEKKGVLKNKKNLIEAYIRNYLRLPYTDIEVYPVLAKDSLDFNIEDKDLILSTVCYVQEKLDPIVIIHGTDTLEISAKQCLLQLNTIKVPIVFTGAMWPVELNKSDAMQNIAESLLAAKFLKSGVYVSFHGQIFDADNVKKNYSTGTFEVYH